jgi:nucleotide-binding universal stress UspA family protein
MGTLSRSGVGGLLIGNTADRITGNIECALLTLEPRDFVWPEPVA